MAGQFHPVHVNGLDTCKCFCKNIVFTCDMADRMRVAEFLGQEIRVFSVSVMKLLGDGLAISKGSEL